MLLRLVSFVQQDIYAWSLNAGATLYCITFILSTVDIHLGCFRFLVLTDNTVVNTLVLIICGTDTQKWGCGFVLMLDFSSYHQTDFRSGCADFYRSAPHLLVVLGPCQHLIFACPFNISPPGEYLFISRLAIWIFSFVVHLYKIFIHFFFPTERFVLIPHL